jgi:aryl-alcohol dehydrogenase-like predicted oxidoreductase
VLAPIAAARGISAHAVVLAWVLAQSPTVIAIPSARTVEHALDSIGAADLELTRDELASIDAAEFSRV